MMRCEEGKLDRNMQPGRGPALIPVKEFANRLGCSLSTARKLCYARTVSTVKYSKSLMVVESEVGRLISENLTPALTGTE